MAAGHPARRFVGSPVRQFAGLLVCWFVGLLVCWFVGLPVRRFAVRDLSGSRFRRALRYRLAASAYCRVAA
ncbi:hypothetical protein [Burkholderia pseudomallei]|uniref:hypothetical protein n=1 Tax=Burkholderia pseudomallei TaxID=28450 RepID=UPI000E69986A|nr:hypothetical protein [Burkholderia pseudomallei]RIV71097.1 hypothetical protein D2W72_13815 [Burkholderia pseudomallei]RIV74980.1 hypothetical protein D2V84_19280 [Burkholderia pseudomallei]